MFYDRSTYGGWFVACLALVAGSMSVVAQTSEQELNLTLTSNGQPRAYRVFVPEGFGKSAPGPAVVLFNGSGSAVDGLLDPWKEVARKEGVLLIGPAAFKSGAWRIPEDSPDFTQEVVESAKARFPIDQRRIYFSAIPAGPGHVLLLGLLESEYFAAVGRARRRLTTGRSRAARRAAAQDPDGDLDRHQGSDGADQNGA